MLADTLSLPDCLQIAGSRSLQAIQGVLIEAHAQSAHEELSRGRLPQLSALATLDKSDDPATQLPDANKAVLRIEQTGFPFSQAWIRGTQKEGEYRAATFTRIESQQDVLLGVKQLYFSILKEQDTTGRLSQVEEQLNSLLLSVIPRYTVGRAPPFDLVKIKTSISDLARTRELTAAQIAGDKSQLAQILGMKPDAGFEMQAISKTPALPRLEAPEAMTSRNPTLQSLSEGARVANLGIQAARYSRVPSLIAAFEYGYSGQTTKAMTLGWDVSLGLKLPLFDWGVISSQVSQASLSAALAENKLQAERRKEVSDLIQAQAMAQAHLSDQNRLKPLVSETHRTALLSIDRYKKGGIGILETTDAVSLWIQTLLNERSAYYSYLSDLAKIDRLQGTRLYEDF